MRKILLLVLASVSFSAGAQSVKQYLRADTVFVQKDNGNGELVILNSTRDSVGVLYNIGKGRTRFVKPQMINDSTLVIGLDTLVFKGSASAIGNGGVEGKYYPGDGLYFMNDSTFAIDTTRIRTVNSSYSKSEMVGILAVKMGFSDSTLMLQPYLRKGDTLNMLSPYIRAAGYGLARNGRALQLDSATVFPHIRNTITLPGKLNVTDTATMLSPYLRDRGYGLAGTGQTVRADTAVLFPAVRATIPPGVTDISGKLNISDTLAMLQNYFNKYGIGLLRSGQTLRLDTASERSYARSVANTGGVPSGIQAADTSAMLSPYLRERGYGLARSGQTVRADTAVLFPAVRSTIPTPNLAGKLNISDTAAMMGPYETTGDVIARLAPKVNATDTSSMLNPYIRDRGYGINRVGRALALDTATVFPAVRSTIAPTNISGKLNISDTAGMLANYEKTANAIARDNFKLSKSDTAAMLASYLNDRGYGLARSGKVVRADTAVLFPALRATLPPPGGDVSGKVNYTDTAAMLVNYFNKFGYGLQRSGQTLRLDTATERSYARSVANTGGVPSGIQAADTAAMLAPYEKAANSIARNNLKVNIADTSTMLSPYETTADVNAKLQAKVNVADTSAMLGNYLVDRGYGLARTGKVVRADTAVLFPALRATLPPSAGGSDPAKLNISDTAAMLSPYETSADAIARVSLKVNIADTANQLSPYIRDRGYGLSRNGRALLLDSATVFPQIRATIPAAAGSDPLKVNVADTAAMLAPYETTADVIARLASKVNVVDTSAQLAPYIRDKAYGLGRSGQSLSLDSGTVFPQIRATIPVPSVAGKLNITDTASMLSPYETTADAIARLNLKLNLGDSAGMLSPYLRHVGDGLIRSAQAIRLDTARERSYARSLTPDIAGKVSYSDTASMLGNYEKTANSIARNNLKVNIADSSAMLNPYVRDRGYGLSRNGRALLLDTTTVFPAIRSTIPTPGPDASKVNVTDTSSMLSPYEKSANVLARLGLKLNLADTATMLSGYQRIGAPVYKTYARNGLTKATDSSTLELGGMLSKTTFFTTGTHGRGNATGANPVVITNKSFPDSTAYNPAYFLDAPYSHSDLIVSSMRKESWGDINPGQYGAPIRTFASWYADSASTRYGVGTAGNQPITVPYQGVFVTSRVFPPRDTTNWDVMLDGGTASAFAGALDIGNTYGYNVNVRNYPLSTFKSSNDFVREIDNTRRKKMTGEGVSGYFSSWKLYQNPISTGSYEVGNYINKFAGFTAFGSHYKDLNLAGNKAKILRVSTVDTSIGLDIFAQYDSRNEVANGYGVYQRGEDDFNYYRGKTKMGGSVPSTANSPAQNYALEVASRGDGNASLFVADYQQINMKRKTPGGAETYASILVRNDDNSPAAALTWDYANHRQSFSTYSNVDQLTMDVNQATQMQIRADTIRNYVPTKMEYATVSTSDSSDLASTNKWVKQVLASFSGGGGGGGTAPVVASSAEVNTGTDNAKFISPAALAGSDYLDQTNGKLFGSATGSGSSWAVTISPSFTPVTGTIIWVTFPTAPSAGSTLNVNSTTARNIVYEASSNLAGSMIAAGVTVGLQYTSSNTWRIISRITDPLKANLASPGFSGTPTAPTASSSTNTTQIATTAYVRSLVGMNVNSTPTLAAVTNCSSPAVAGQTRVTFNDGIVYVDGTVTVTVTAGLNTFTEFTMTPPVTAAGITGVNDVSGVGSFKDAGNGIHSVFIEGKNSNLISFQLSAMMAGTHIIKYHFQYRRS